MLIRFLLLPLLLTGCYADELREEMTEEPFFDLASYMDAQVDSLEQAGTTVTKTIHLNGTTETKELSDLNFANDLKVFREADINKPAYLDKYTVDKQESEGRLVRTYTAIDSSMQTRRLTVVSRDDRPIRVEIIRKTGTVLSQGDHHLVYDPLSGYHLHTDQVNRFGDDLDADITVRWK
ncbi:hypothetical protein GGR26_000275 [Lewinella marina]|uniref:Lipoprotein n=1 Tax=Neolewinella marina TaxID=438751 RepID=A0A2G0CJZ1_9BACT|nr:hypothetical protein [Neolewinella marina]NJB84530.1 hypothetical protein [Neolewinella marina]PHL00285.1 hypothetical protein CGL56_04415 [Neolewinella marina]